MQTAGSRISLSKMDDFKSRLNQYCQEFRLRPLPKYSTKPLANLPFKPSPIFKSSVQLHDGQVFESEGTFKNKKKAEQSAALVAWRYMYIKRGTLPSPKTSPTSSSTTTSSLPEKESTERCASEKEGIDTASVSPDSSTSPSTIPPTPAVEEKRNIVSSSPTTNVPSLGSSKSLLNERAQKLHLTQPSYNSFIEDGSYCSIVTFNNESYRSKGFFSHKKEAEKSAAQMALLALGMQYGYGIHPKPAVDVPTSFVSQSQLASHTPFKDHSISIFSTQTPTPQVISFKNVLQEYMQQRRSGENPKYSTVSLGDGLFKSTVTCFGKEAESSQGFPTKKEAEQSAARAALINLGIEDPEEIALIKSKGKGRSVASYLSFKSLLEMPKFERNRKRPRLDDGNTPSKKLKLESQEVIKEIGLLNCLTVGEIWKEKGNVVLVGNAETSFVLYCTKANNSPKLLNTRTMENHTLQPGDRIIGLDGDIVNSQGKLVLQAKKCADIEVPNKPDPVLISCGTVTLHPRQDSDDIEVLLKRYSVSQAFVNVKAAMAQFFRRALKGNPVVLPIRDLTEHIETWKLDEVVGIATMTAESIKPLFSSKWKFKEQWSKVLQPPLPRDLKELQTKAEQELCHRNSMGINVTDFENHPWSLPKGNFRHRLLKTGLHIEKPEECAARELHEETGIQLFATDLESMPYIDVPQTDNLNPHMGDVSRYFLYVYKENPGINTYRAEDRSFTSMYELETSTDSVGMDGNAQLSATTESGNIVKRKQQDLLTSENMSDEKQFERVEMQPVSLSELIGEQLASERQKESCNNLLKVDVEPQSFVVDDESTSSSSSSSTSSPSHKTSPLNTEFPSSEEQKANEDDAEKDSERVLADETIVTNNSQTDFKHEDVEICTRGRKRKRSLSDDEEEYNPYKPTTPSSDAALFSSYQSPSVKGGSHEECAWFPLEEAVKMSPVFAGIYENQTFIDLLETLGSTR